MGQTLKTEQLFTFKYRLLSNNALVSFAIMERLKLRFSGSFYNMQKMSKGDYMEMDCTLCNAQPIDYALEFLNCKQSTEHGACTQ